MIINLNKSNLKPKRVVILGAGGFVSSYVSRKLKDKKINVLNLTRKKLDLTKNSSVQKLSKILKKHDTLFFAAAKAPVKTNEMFLQNLLMCKIVVNVLKKKNENHIIYLSSDAVYSDSRKPISENSETKPNSLHGLMHLTREVMLSNLQRNHFCMARRNICRCLSRRFKEIFKSFSYKFF